MARTLGDALKVARQRQRLTQSAVAKAAGVPQPLLSQLEANKRHDCSLSTASALCDALGLSLDRLVSEIFGGRRRGHEQDLSAGEMLAAAERIDAALDQLDGVREGLQSARQALKAPARRQKR